MEMKDLLLADCLVHTGFGGRACLKQSANYRQYWLCCCMCLLNSNLVCVLTLEITKLTSQCFLSR